MRSAARLLFHRGAGELTLLLLDEGGDVQGLDLRELVEVVGLAPFGEAAGRLGDRLCACGRVDLAVKNSRTRFAAFGVGANSRAGIRPAGGGQQ